MRAYPEILPATANLASRYHKVTEPDMKKLTRVAEYIFRCEVIVCADAAYATLAGLNSYQLGVNQTGVVGLH